ncbi:UPF0175 family protein [Zooshikella harenae]|uniref:UPF0175 family protein n=1 Tax=Zooshikella harenae TaxID=2827238 RepID=A0ABS5ZIC8_9GAMM|nr:UPF0175 family protein [Zooshikella harenae]MBU2713538.1 UPF0175 family protein [Zooshikella harenae]
MKTIGIRRLRENPGLLTQWSQEGEYTLITNRSEPVSLSIPFNQALLDQGVQTNIAIKLFEDKVLTLVQAAKLARLSVETFLGKLSALNIPVVDLDETELDEDLKHFE